MKRSIWSRLGMLAAGAVLTASSAGAQEIKFQSPETIQAAGAQLLGGKFINSATAGGVAGGDRALQFGSSKEGVVLNDFTIPAEGWAQFCFKLTKPAANQNEYFLIDSLGTPDWHNRFFVSFRPDASGNGFVSFAIVGKPGEQRVKAAVVIAPDEWHQVAIRWKNVNSGNPDGEMELFWDGKSVASLKGKKVDLPAPSKKLYIGNMDLASSRRMQCGAETFAMDQFEIASGAFPAEKMDKLVKALPKIQVRDMADGEPLLPVEVKGGGDRQYTEVAFADFPYKNGTFWCRCTLSEIIPGRSVLLFDSCGTPNWYDRIGMAIRMKENNQVKLEIFTCGEPCGFYCNRQADKLVDWEPGSTHTVAYQWKNVSSGKADMELTCYLDGVNIFSLDKSSSNITHPAPFVRIGGSTPPASTEAKKDVLTVHECRFWRTLISASDIAALCEKKKITEQQNTQIQVPKTAALAIAPQPDAAFWSKAADFGWLHHYRKGKYAVGNTVIKCGYDDQNLYFAWRAKLTGGRPDGSAKEKRDASVWQEDSVEFLLGSGADCIHLVLNAYGAIFDEKNGKSDWNSAARYAVGYDAKEWYGTLAIPLSELPVTPERTLPVTVCRNAATFQAESSSWLATKFGDTGTLVMADQDTAITEWGIPAKPIVGSNHGSLKVYRAGTAKGSLKLDLVVKTENGKPAITRLQRELPAGTREIPFDFAVNDEGKNEYTLTVTDNSGKVLFANSGFFLADPQLKVATRGDFYHQQLQATVDAVQVPGIQNDGVAEIVQGNQVLLQTPFQLQKGIAALKLDTGNLKTYGEYTLRVTMTKKDGGKIVRETPFLFAPRPDYISKTAGTKTYFGKDWFTPKYENGTVKVWGRDYVWKDSLFPVSIVSAGDELLAAPMYFEYRRDGQLKRLNSAKITPQPGTAEKTVFTAVAEDDALTVKAQIFVEYDGHIGYDLDLAPKGNAKIDYLALVMPLTARNARYKMQDHEENYSESRCNIATYPANGKAFGLSNMAGVGTTDRALFFYTESDEGWLPYNRDNVEKITPKGDQVEWRWTIVDGAPLKTLPTQRWGFMASPYRTLAESEITSFRHLGLWPGGVFYPDDVPYATKNLAYYKSQGVNVVHLHMNWPKYTGGHEPDDPERLKAFVKACHEQGIRVLVYLSMLVNEYEPGRVHYGDVWMRHPTVGWFGYPWELKTKYASLCICSDAPDVVDWWLGGCEKLMKEYDLDGFYYDFGIGFCNNASHGCGFAGGQASVVAGESSDTLGVNVGDLSAEDKSRGRTLTMRSTRELWRRMYNLVKEYKGEDGCIYAHTSEAAQIFTFPFMDVTVHSEHAACHGFGDWTSLEKYRIAYSRQDLGTRGHPIIPKQNTREAARQLLALSLPHREMPSLCAGHAGAINSDYGTRESVKLRKVLLALDVDHAEWLPYYQNQQLVKIEDATPLTNVSVWYRPESAVFVLSNISKEDRTFNVHLSGKLQGYTQAKDVDEANGTAAIADNVLTVKVGKNDFRLIQLTK